MNEIELPVEGVTLSTCPKRVKTLNQKQLAMNTKRKLALTTDSIHLALDKQTLT